MLVNLREYHCPDTLDEALALLNRKDIVTVPLAGGSQILASEDSSIEAVVDLQDLALETISFSGGEMSLGAMVRVQTLVEEFADEVDGLLAKTALLMGGRNLRSHMTVGGVLASKDIHSSLSILFCALGAEVLLVGEKKGLVSWHSCANTTSPDWLKKSLILDISFEYAEKRGAYHQVGRTSRDRPIVAAACILNNATSPKGITLAVGGFRKDLFSTTLPLAVDAENKLVDHIHQAAKSEADLISDNLGHSTYRTYLAELLAKRAFADALNLSE